MFELFEVASVTRKRERNFENNGLKEGNRLPSVNTCSFDDFSPWANNTRISFVRKEKKKYFFSVITILHIL